MAPKPGFNDEVFGARIVFGIARRVLPPMTFKEMYSALHLMLCPLASVRQQLQLPRVERMRKVRVFLQITPCPGQEERLFKDTGS